MTLKQSTITINVELDAPLNLQYASTVESLIREIVRFAIVHLDMVELSAIRGSALTRAEISNLC
ncbi:unnamed protein product [Strongylus vulgaris]|uniref:Uncharacterized protein n=1 Tax=Strongylus vulgaris TaxID=40348 RepID=A0A3P7J6V3_STRVU|nr:unnamed protein product [Strongylus vulgaris]